MHRPWIQIPHTNFYYYHSSQIITKWKGPNIFETECIKILNLLMDQIPNFKAPATTAQHNSKPFSAFHFKNLRPTQRT